MQATSKDRPTGTDGGRGPTGPTGTDGGRRPKSTATIRTYMDWVPDWTPVSLEPLVSVSQTKKNPGPLTNDLLTKNPDQEFKKEISQLGLKQLSRQAQASCMI